MLAYPPAGLHLANLDFLCSSAPVRILSWVLRWVLLGEFRRHFALPLRQSVVLRLLRGVLVPAAGSAEKTQTGLNQGEKEKWMMKKSCPIAL